MKKILKKITDWGTLAQEILPWLTPGTILALSGPLGAGKTTFVQSLARALGIKSTPVSPTFSLVRQYRIARHAHLRQLVHVDAYRLDQPADVLALGLDELLVQPGAIMCVEWPENVVEWLEKQTKIVPITINVEADSSRTVIFSRR